MKYYFITVQFRDGYTHSHAKQAESAFSLFLEVMKGNKEWDMRLLYTAELTEEEFKQFNQQRDELFTT